MKNFTLRLLGVMFALTATLGCSYDDSDILNRVNNIDDRLTTLEQSIATINSDIASLNTIVGALQRNIAVSEVTTTAEGYIIHFSDGTTATIRHGNDGTNGTNAPIISIAEEDGAYYWTIDGEWLLVDGERVRANGIDGTNGQNGANAVAPQVRINDTTKEWEVSTDGGTTWTSTGVVAEGKDGENGTSGAAGDSLFKGVDSTNEEYVTVILADGTELRLARHNDLSPRFTVADADEPIVLEYGASIALAVEEQNVADYTITKPEGWKVEYTEAVLTITAPSKELCHYDKVGVVAITAVSAEGRTVITKIEVEAGEWVDEVVLRTLTFEDDDARFEAYELSYCGATITTWSDLIAEDQYMSTLIYDMSGSEPYHWYDKGNTEICHAFPYNYGSYAYWGGGHAISNYANTDFVTYGDYMSQLTAVGEEGAGGHNGSQNFCMHFGYKDDSGYNYTEELPSIMFGDGEARVIDHIWVNNSCYALNCYTNGNGLTESVSDEDKAWITAIGYDENDEATGEATFYLVDGPENIVMEWAKWDLTTLGKVLRVEFNVGGTNDNGFGYSQPAYFAYDDVAVQFAEKVFK